MTWEQPPQPAGGRDVDMPIMQIQGVEYELTFTGCTWKVLVGGHEASRKDAQIAAAKFVDSLRSR